MICLKLFSERAKSLNMAWLWTACTILAMAYFVMQILLPKTSNTKHKKLPPGPRKLPIIGNLHLLGKLPYIDLQELAKKHGSIMYMQLGFVPAIIVSSPESAELFLQTYDHTFASRPPHEAAKHMTYNQTNMSFSPYGPYWRDMRKLCSLELLSSHKIDSFKTMRKEELSLLIKSIKKSADERVAVDLSADITTLGAGMSCRMVLGRKYENEEFHAKGFKAVIKEGVHLGAVANIADFIPPLACLDLQGLTRRMKAVGKVFDDLLEKVIDDHIESRKQGRKSDDFVDILLGLMESDGNEFEIHRSKLKTIALDLLVASIDTTSRVIEWALSFIIKHPNVMKTLQKELEAKIGLNRMVEESDLEGLDYLEMVIKESMRLHPVVPLLIPHMAIEDSTVNGYHIPKNSRVIINAWAIGRDPEAWTDPEKFMPERFMGSDIDLKGRHFQLIPFGSGRRGCPGMPLGLIVVRLVLAQLVHCFDWELTDGKSVDDLDMTAFFGLSLSRAVHLTVVPTYRLTSDICATAAAAEG